MKVSAIVPVYNVEDYLGRYLDSLIKQTHQDYEIICINDCSPDGSAEILDSYQYEHPGLIKVYHNENNPSLGKTREQSPSLANGDYIPFVNNGDCVKRNYISSYTDALEEGDYNIVIGDYIRDVASKKTAHLLSNSVLSSVTYAIACANRSRRASSLTTSDSLGGYRGSSFVGHLFQSVYLTKKLLSQNRCNAS